MDCQLGALCLLEAEPRIQFGCRLSPTYAGARSRCQRLRGVGACFGGAIMAALAGGATHHGMNSPKSLALRKQSGSPIWLPTSYMRRVVISLTELYARNRDLMHELV